MKIIITGANGFLGSYLARAFAKDNFEVVAVVRNEKSDVSNILDINNINIVYCDLNDINLLCKKISCDCDLFFHFAWEASSGIARHDEAIQLKNVHSTCEAVKVAKKLGCKRFIFAASIMGYEAREYVSINEARPTLSYIYSIAKLTASMMAKTIAVSQGIEYIDAVISNVYGVGENSARFINTTIHKMLNNEVINLTSCEQSYDFIYVSDASEEIKLVALKGENLNSYYIGNSNQPSLKEFVLRMKNTLDSKSQLNFGVIPFSGVYFDYKKVLDTDAVMRLGYTPTISFEDGINILRNDLIVKNSKI